MSERHSPAFASPQALAVRLRVARLGRRTLAVVVDLGRMATLLGDAARALVRPAASAPPFRPAFVKQLATILIMGLPLVALVHIGMGSFLSLQAYYGGTFVDGTGAVVGVGMIRNVGPMMAGLILAALVAALTTTELRVRPWSGLDGDPLWTADRDADASQTLESLSRPDPARLAGVRIAAAVVAGPILAFWGAAVGTVVGWQVAKGILGVTTHGYFSMMWEMLWLRDVTGLVIKGLFYGLLTALFACHEGLRGGGEPEPDPDVVAWAVFRATCWSSIAVLVANSGWFLLLYHAGPAFGPTLLAPRGG
jgi:phospholipid/cholesterol/gamma-HCH transport system permease protein